jgi:hypothetical protein
VAARFSRHVYNSQAHPNTFIGFALNFSTPNLKKWIPITRLKKDTCLNPKCNHFLVEWIQKSLCGPPSYLKSSQKGSFKTASFPALTIAVNPVSDVGVPVLSLVVHVHDSEIQLWQGTNCPFVQGIVVGMQLCSSFFLDLSSFLDGCRGGTFMLGMALMVVDVPIVLLITFVIVVYVPLGNNQG